MKRKLSAHSGFFNLRASIAILLCAAAACSVLSATLLGFFSPEVSSKVSQRTLSFSDRVAYQRAIEEVYWLHRIWPKDGPDPKPSLDAVMSQAQLEKKVEDYLRSSQALEDYWQRPLTAQDLQAEMDRMAQHTKRPDVLRELFEALGNDPFVIAECVAKPVLCERLVTNFCGQDQGFHRELRPRAQSWKASAENQLPKIVSAASAKYTLPTISDTATGCIPDTWTATTTNNAPDARYGHTAVWTGTEMIVWGGFAGGMNLNTGGRYDPSSDSWGTHQHHQFA